MNKKFLLILSIVLAFFSFPIFAGEVAVREPLAESELQKMRLMTEAYLKMQKHYFREIPKKNLEKLFFRTEVVAGTLLKNRSESFEDDLDLLIYGTIEWMVRELRDPTDEISKFIHKKHLKKVVRDNLTSKFTGIGIEVEERDGGFYISKIYKDSSAEEEGLLVQDEIIRINDEDVFERALKDIEKLLNIPDSETVKLSLLREGQTRLFDVVLLSRIIVIPSVSSRFDDEARAGYLRIAEFRNETAEEVKEHLNNLIKLKSKGLVIDLRGNDGGNLEAAIAIADLFLPQDEIVCFFLKRDVGRQDQKTNTKPKSLGKIRKVVILVDEKSGSSSEILAGSLRHYKGITLIGKRTKGLGSLKNMINLSDGSVLYLITSRTFLPDETTFDAVGIEPDILVEEPEAQLARAIAFVG